jgi:hypothetical protein
MQPKLSQRAGDELEQERRVEDAKQVLKSIYS